VNGLRQHSALKPDSTLLCVPIDGGKQLEQDLVHCVHCGRMWAVGHVFATNVGWRFKDLSKCFGFCSKCNGITCPGEKCQKCVPLEQQIENIEAGKPTLTPKAPMISTTGLILPGE
jgi:hypothetical protein